MTVVNQQGEIITEYDLSLGYLDRRRLIKPEAIPLGEEITVEKDGKIITKKKQIWEEDDFEEIFIYTLRPAKTTEEKIAELKTQLSDTDYKIIKCSEYQLVGKEAPYDIATLHAERQAIRDEINELESSLV